MPIVPDDKDWTWVLERPCPDCGLDVSEIDPAAIAKGIRVNAAEWQRLLDHPMAGRRPSDDQWSALEYGCHVRDVFRIFRTRLALLLDEDDPTFANWDQDATAIEDRYIDQEPAVVADEITEAASALADAFDAVIGEQWERTGGRSDGARFSVDTLGRYLLHDPVHHVWDVESGYRVLG